MNSQKMSEKIKNIIIAIPLLIVIVLAAVCAGICMLFTMPKIRKEYKKSRYYTDFHEKFSEYIMHSSEYRFYNSAMRRNLPMKYIKQSSNGLEYFVYKGTLYLFPDFYQIDFDTDKNEWQADYDDDWKSFDESYAELLAKLENVSDYPVKLLVERKMIPVFNLNGTDIPECIFITLNYENAFENDNSPVKMIVPQNSEELYQMMLQTPDLCGTFRLDEKKNLIVWDLFEKIRVEISVTPDDCYFGLCKFLFGKLESCIMHWHPSAFEVYDDVCNVGKRGNVTVVRTSVFGDSLLYSGRKDDCPYSSDKKCLFGKYYYLEAE